MGDSRLVVGGWLADRDGPGYYRVRVPLDALARRGHSVEYSAAMPWRHGLRPASHVLVGQRVSNAAAAARWVRAAGQVRRVFEVDDALLDVDPSSPRAHAFYSDRAVRARLLENMRSADAVTVSTPFLADVVSDLYGVSAPVHVLPNCLTREVLQLPPVGQAGAMRIGWAGSDTHRGDFEAVRQPLRRFFRRHPEVELVMGGVDYSSLLGIQARVRPWVPIWDDPAGYMAGLDWNVGLAPLASTLFTRSKSALKALEYAARGIVVVASDVEPYSRFVRDGVTGFLVRRPHEWLDRLELLRSDPELRARMSVAARDQAADWCIDGHAHLWEQAYQG